MRKTHLVVLASIAVVIVLAIGAVSAYADLASDTQAPVTTTDAVASYWDAAAITATATDAEGIAYIYHELDEGVMRCKVVSGSPTSDTLAIPTDKDSGLAVGVHTLKYWAQDVHGNVEVQNTLEFEIKADTVKPTTLAPTAASVVRFRTATLKYKVADAEPNKGMATVVIKVRNRLGTTVKTLNAGTVTVNVPLSAKFKCRLAKGTYRFSVYATDMSGNVQAKIGSNRLTVR